MHPSLLKLILYLQYIKIIHVTNLPTLRIFPIKIQTIKIILFDKLQCVRNESLSSSGIIDEF